MAARLSRLRPLPRKEPVVARTKSALKNRPKYKRERSLKDRRMKARKKAAHKRGLKRAKKRRAARTSK